MQIAEWNRLGLTNNDLGRCSLLMCVDLTRFTSKWGVLHISSGSSPGCCSRRGGCTVFLLRKATQDMLPLRRRRLASFCAKPRKTWPCLFFWQNPLIIILSSFSSSLASQVLAMCSCKKLFPKRNKLEQRLL